MGGMQPPICGVGLTLVNLVGCFKSFCSLGAHGRQNNRTRRVLG